MLDIISPYGKMSTRKGVALVAEPLLTDPTRVGGKTARGSE
jgi:hypothetical protein